MPVRSIPALAIAAAILVPLTAAAGQASGSFTVTATVVRAVPLPPPLRTASPGTALDGTGPERSPSGRPEVPVASLAVVPTAGAVVFTDGAPPAFAVRPR